MVYTRSQKVAAHTLLSLKNDSRPTDTEFWSMWTAWYHAFACEVEDELKTPTRKVLRQEAESRWATFSAKKLRCDTAYVYLWLHSSSKARMTHA